MSNPQILLSTTLGDITLELFPQGAPKAVENFVGLTEQGYYDGIIFHRVIRDFMIQGGDPTGTGSGGKSLWNRAFEDEFSDTTLTHKKGVISMANAGRNTNGSQFFIVTAQDASFLDRKHTIFGHVISGMDIVEKIEASKTDRNDKPLEEVKIIKAIVISK
ncbi:peptidylprolyl isomerase [Candidatus Gracilibacteria bacterium]|nr:peptidylprolyl isomerase [Candidatus Gracilibacteria bacterium]